ncbi:ABC transporter ATP-binding protein [Methanobrevibacter millerae]|uniref:ABC-type multidrug transport system, ATPase and permease component n=1 Tax=Methanobrevibacter millerae TaxID=230361 RepID=A0A1G5W290_9EURY|nr:ABC transporter ATP-binding protein [Methanobrevibacter millerae]SDA51325.1 ABC-type multidrug transport system, ATPase and permease component [Methanobrevibacter millerae]
MVYKYSTKELTSKLISLLKEYKYQILAAITIMIISVILSVYAPKLVGKLINSLMRYALDLNDTPPKNLFNDVIIIVILFTISYLIRIPASRIMAKTSEGAIQKLRNQLYAKLSYIDIDESEFDGNIMARINNDVANLKAFISNTIILFLSDVAIIIFVLWMSSDMDLKLSGILFALALIYPFVIYPFHKKTRDQYKIHQNDLGNIMGFIGDFLKNRMMIESFNSEEYSRKRFREYNIRQKDSYKKSRFYTEAMYPVNSFITINLQVFLYIYGGLLVYVGSIDMGTFTTFVLYYQLMKKPIISIGNTLNTVRTSYACLDRIYEILDSPEKRKEEFPEVDGISEIEFENITYGEIKDFNLKILPGEHVCLTGDKRNDLIKIFLGLLEAENGSVKVNDLDLSKYDINSNKNLIGVSTEENYVIDGTVEENIVCGDEFSPEDVMEVCESIGLHSLIEKFPDRYETKISFDSHNISTRERKLICLARALMRDPELLIVDYNKDLGIDLLTKIIEGRTTIVLAQDDDVANMLDMKALPIN